MADLLPRTQRGVVKHLAGIAIAALAVASLSQTLGVRVAAATSTLSIHVQGNQLVNSAGNVVTLHGVDRSGGEYMCVQGTGDVFDGPSDAASVAAMASWNINAVRVPLNEDCWLGINGASPGGATYQTAIENYVSLLNSYGLYAILDLHWSAPGTTLATGQEPMPDQSNSPAFWTSVATAFKSDPAVIFDLFNEPYPDSNQDTRAAWECVLDGGTCPGVSYTAAGMQELLNDVRATGATNVVMSPGVQYTNTLDDWLQYEPSDPVHQLAASFHGYNFNICTTASCWNSELAPVAAQVPLISGEIGEDDQADTYVDAYMVWADSRGVSYLAWTWDTWVCDSGPVLISNYSGTACSGFGAGYEAHLASLPSSSWQPPVSLGATLGTGTAQPISWGPGNEEVFWRGTDNNLYEEYAIDGTWYGPDQLTTSGNLASNPEPVSWGVGNLEVFWRGSDGNLWQMYYLNGWQGPASLGDGPLGNATPVPISWGPGNIEVFWEGTDQNVWEAYYANGWHGPAGLGDGPLGTATTLSAVSWGTGNLELFWKGTDKNLWEAYYANGWHGPVGLGDGPLGSAPHPVATESGVLDVFWEGSDGNLWHAWYLGGGWNGPASLGSGPMGSQPEVTSWGGGRVDVFWVGTDGNLWHDWYQNGWTGPQNLGGTPLDSLPEPVTTRQPGHIDVVWTGPSSTLWHVSYGG
jgi:hypothetical protein